MFLLFYFLSWLCVCLWFRSAVWAQQHLLLLYDSMPGVLRRPGGSLWVWANTVCGGMSVRLWLCSERPRLCALQQVWMHLPRSLLSGEPFDACQILQVKGYDVKGIAQDTADHVSLYLSTCSWRIHLLQRIVHRVVNVLPLVLCVKQRAVETKRPALCTTPNVTVINVSYFWCKIYLINI